MNDLTAEAYYELVNSNKPILAIVRGIDHTIKHKGTKSEKAIIRAEVIESAIGDASGEVFLERYTQGDPYVQPGMLYLVAAYEEWADHYYLAGWSQVSEEQASAALKSALQKYQEKKAALE